MVAFRKREVAMTVVCAWCQHQGRMTVLREKEPLDYPVVSHGICEEHAVAFMDEIRAQIPSTSLDRRAS